MRRRAPSAAVRSVTRITTAITTTEIRARRPGSVGSSRSGLASSQRARMSEALLTVEDLHLAFGGVRALRGVSLAVRRGEIFSLKIGRAHV